MTKEPAPDEKPRDPPLVPPRKSEAKPGWIEGLAQQSAGLPPPISESPPPAKDREKSPWSHAGMGIQFAVTTALFTLMGVYVDRHWGTSPWGTLGLTLLGLVGGMYLLIKDALKANAAPDKKDDTPHKDNGP